MICFSNWEKAAEVDGNTTVAKVTDLTEGEEYEFRIVACNKGGHSDPSDPSNPCICKVRFRKYHYHHNHSNGFQCSFTKPATIFWYQVKSLLPKYNFVRC